MSNKPSIKRGYESTMASAFREAGVEAVEAGNTIPEGTESNRDVIKNALAEKGFDTILVTRMVSNRKETYYVPGQPYHAPYPYYNHFYDYYTSVYPVVYTPGYLATDTIVVLETNIYELKDGKLIWTVLSETINPQDVGKEVAAISKLFVKRLKKDGLLTSAGK